VHVLDPFAITGFNSAAFNPLDHLEADGLDFAEVVETLSDVLVLDEPGIAGEAHWDEEAKTLIAGLILMIVSTAPPDGPNLGTLRRHLAADPQSFADLLNRMQQMQEANGLIAQAANRRSSIEATAHLRRLCAAADLSSLSNRSLHSFLATDPAALARSKRPPLTKEQ
jgi:type IV secretion system protein VirD4